MGLFTQKYFLGTPGPPAEVAEGAQTWGPLLSFHLHILKILSVSGCSEAIWPPLAHFVVKFFGGGGAKHTSALPLRFLGGMAPGGLAPGSALLLCTIGGNVERFRTARNRSRAFHKRVIPYHENYHIKCDGYKLIFCNCIIFRGPELESHLEPHYITIIFAGFWFPQSLVYFIRMFTFVSALQPSPLSQSYDI